MLYCKDVIVSLIRGWLIYLGEFKEMVKVIIIRKIVVEIVIAARRRNIEV